MIGILFTVVLFLLVFINGCFSRSIFNAAFVAPTIVMLSMQVGMMTKRDGIALTVSVMNTDLFAQNEQTPVNHYYIESTYRGEQCSFLLQVNDIIKKVGGWWDKSDIQTDYFNTAFYYDIRIGQWNKPHQRIPLK